MATCCVASAMLRTAYAMPSLYAVTVASFPHLGSARFVDKFGSESGSMTSTIGTLPSYFRSTLTILSMYSALYSAKPASHVPGAP